MNKKDLIREVAAATGQSQFDVATTVDAVMECIYKSLANGQTVAINSFGKFELTRRGPRRARNPATGITASYPAKTFPRFVPGKGLRDAAATSPLAD